MLYHLIFVIGLVSVHNYSLKSPAGCPVLDDRDSMQQVVAKAPAHSIKGVYDGLQGNLPDYKVFEKAYQGYLVLLSQKKIEKKLITVIDYGKSSNEKRLWVIDLGQNKVIFHELVAHGKNSGNEFATQFSNTPHTHMSSLGFFVTDHTYYGKHGFSLRIDGIEPGINDKARQRAIVVHGADYVSTGFIAKYGRLGRSQGCPALSGQSTQPIIEAIANKSCIYIHGPSENYALHSTVLNAQGGMAQDTRN
jgi:hypothetical protein